MLCTKDLILHNMSKINLYEKGGSGETFLRDFLEILIPQLQNY